LHVNGKTAAWKGVFERGGERFVRANLKNGLKGCGEIAAIVMQNGSEGADLRRSGGGFGVGAEVVVEAPAADGLADCEHLRSAGGIGDAGEHTVGIREVLGEHHGLFVSRSR